MLYILFGECNAKLRKRAFTIISIKFYNHVGIVFISSAVQKDLTLIAIIECRHARTHKM